MILKEQHKQELFEAMLKLEHPGLAAKITNLIGRPIEKGIELLPKNWKGKVSKVVEQSLMKATDAAMLTLKDEPNESSSNWLHKVGAAVSGGVGGFFGLPALAIELPVSTTIILRSIADIARSEGESINNAETKLACIQVFALGGTNQSDDGVETGYFAIRVALARSTAEAIEVLATKTITDEGLPALLKFIVKVAERFSIQVTEKLAAQSIPIIGAAGGAIINTLFIDHFQEMAKGHFVVRRLERIYGKESVEKLYKELVSLKP